RLRVPTWEVHANTGVAARRGVPVPNQPDLYPDVVAFEKYTGRLAAIGAVETAETLEAGAKEWKLLQMVAPRFYIYVPREVLEKAMRLCRRYGVPTAAVRAYSYRSGAAAEGCTATETNTRPRFVVERGWRTLKREGATPPEKPIGRPTER
ncbi:MAG: hypothetical protein QHJ73_18735, partial [Armatimonadota bacterium]|nr:hypothetical protein [Armatimonadota bacterium]